MRPAAIAFAAVGLLALTTAAAPYPPLRIAAVEAVAGPCAPLPASTSAGEKAYYQHLEKRLGVPVLRCPVATEAEAAKALAEGHLDLAVLSPAAFAPVSAGTRSILTVRPEGGLNRIRLILAVPAASPAKSLADLRGGTLVFAGRSPASYVVPKKALADRGAGEGFFGRELVVEDAEDAGARLRAGQAQAVIMHGAAWQRLCPRVAPNKAMPCDDIRILDRIRPQAERALVVRTDMPKELRYRLIGVHMPLHLENKAAFAWAASWTPRPAEFEPTEAQALLVER